MCGGFTCSKNTLIGLNIVYIFVALILIGVGATSKAAGYVESLPVVGGIIACGVFLLFIAIVGLYGALKHHQIALFFYMVVLFAIFVLQFSVACASFAASTKDEMSILQKAWNASKGADDNKLIYDMEKNFDCCGWTDKTEMDKCTAPCVITSKEKNGTETEDRTKCPTCGDILEKNINYAFNSAGGVGIFFAFTEIIGTVLAYRYRNLMDPKAAATSASLFDDQLS